MGFPVRSFQDLNLSNGWTEAGSPTYEANPITGNAGEAFIGDGTNNQLTNAVALVTGSQTDYTIELFFKADTIGLGDIVMAQHSGGGGNGVDFELAANTTLLTIIASNGLLSGNKKTTTSTIDISLIDDGEWHHILCSISPGVAGFIIDGVVPTYNTQNVAGSNGHYDVVRASPIQTTIGEWLVSTANRFFNGSIANVGVWNGTALTADQGADVYADWYPVAGGPGGIISPITQPLIDPIFDGLLS